MAASKASASQPVSLGATLRTVAVIFPPMGFTCIEDTIFRCQGPIVQHSFPFLLSLSLGSIINMSGTLSPALESFAEENHIDLYTTSPNNNADEPYESGNIVELVDWVKNTLELILSLSTISNVLIIGSLEDCLDCLVIGCLRRLQRISLSAIMTEIKILSGGKRMFDLEQFVEMFEPSTIDLSATFPDFLLIDQVLQQSELALPVVGDKSNSNDENSFEIGYRLAKLLNCSDALVSNGFKFDPSLSLVNDKDDDD